jgi:alpha-glucosidase
MARPWDAPSLVASIDETLAAHAPVGAPPTWVLSNHDVTRPVTRYGREDSSFAFARKRSGIPTDVALGRRRARAAALLAAALPGSLYIYQGDELGLDEVAVPEGEIQDPMHERSGGIDPGRDGCRVPLPWSGDWPPFGFSGPSRTDGATTGTAAPWLSQPAHWAGMTVEAQLADPASMLHLYRAMLRIRREEPALGDGDFGWLPSLPGVLAFARDDHFVNVTNISDRPVPLPVDALVLLASDDVSDGALPPDATAWLRTTPITDGDATRRSPSGDS